MSDAMLIQDATVAGGTGERMIVCEGVDKWFGKSGIDLSVVAVPQFEGCS
jgi:hypothetical protein